MTNAPQNLLDVRRLLLDHLDIDDGSYRYNDLEPAEVGIVGDPAHIGGYHCGSDRVRRVDGVIRDYSVIESSRDRAGLSLYASALDVGYFKATTAKGTFDLYHFNRWMVAQCEAGTADTRDIREIIYSPDGKTVKRWDRLGRRTTGDDTHLWHTHFSFFRDARDDQRAVFRRYLIHIGLLEDPMATLDPEDLANIRRQVALGTYDVLYVAATGNDHNGVIFTGPGSIGASVRNNWGVLTRLALAGVDFTDEAAVVNGVLAGLTPEAIAAAIPAAQTAAVADELARRLAA